MATVHNSDPTLAKLCDALGKRYGAANSFPPRVAQAMRATSGKFKAGQIHVDPHNASLAIIGLLHDDAGKQLPSRIRKYASLPRIELTSPPRLAPSPRLGGATTFERAIAWLLDVPSRCDQVDVLRMSTSAPVAQISWLNSREKDDFVQPGGFDPGYIVRFAEITGEDLRTMADIVLKHRPAEGPSQ